MLVPGDVTVGGDQDADANGGEGEGSSECDDGHGHEGMSLVPSLFVFDDL